jgi:hypothetical protein
VNPLLQTPDEFAMNLRGKSILIHVDGRHACQIRGMLKHFFDGKELEAWRAFTDWCALGVG